MTVFPFVWELSINSSVMFASRSPPTPLISAWTSSYTAASLCCFLFNKIFQSTPCHVTLSYVMWLVNVKKLPFCKLPNIPPPHVTFFLQYWKVFFPMWHVSILCIFYSHIYWMVKTTQVIHHRSSCSDLSFHLYFGVLSTFQNHHVHLIQISNGSPAGDSSGWVDCLKVNPEHARGKVWRCDLWSLSFVDVCFCVSVSFVRSCWLICQTPSSAPTRPHQHHPVPPTPTFPHPQPHGGWRRNGAETCGGSEVQRWTSKPQKNPNNNNNNTRNEDVRRWLMEVEEPWSVSRLKPSGAKLHQSWETWKTPAITCSC